MIIIAVITQEMVLHPTQNVMKEVTINAIGATTPIHLIRKAPCTCGAVRRIEAAAIGILAKTSTPAAELTWTSACHEGNGNVQKRAMQKDSHNAALGTPVC